MPASSPQEEIAEKGDIVEPGNHPVAGGTTGPGPYDRHFPGKAVDADIQEASKDQSQEDGQQVKCPWDGFQELDHGLSPACALESL
jgi:hypothetical protein